MAKRQPAADGSTSQSTLSFATVPVKDANDTLRSNRTGRGGGRSSMFAPLLEAAKGLPEGEVLEVKGVAKMQVMGLRNYVFKHLDKDEWTVKSVKEKGGDTYVCVVGRKDDLEKQK